jgi:hypothetical protein
MLRIFSITLSCLLLFSPARAAEVETSHGESLIERARQALGQVAGATDESGREQARAESRKLYDEAYKLYADAEAKAEARLAGFPAFIDPSDTAQIDRRSEARGEAIQAQLATATVIYERAKTFASSSEDFQRQMSRAADKFENVYKRFRTLLVGSYARVKQGQCFQEMGDTRRALGYYADILHQPELEELRKLKASALHLSMQCWVADSQKKYELAALKGEEWLAGSREAEERLSDWLGVRYYTALAYQRHVKSLSAAEAAERGEEIDRALQHARTVAGQAGAYQEAAKQLVAQLARP